MTITIFVVSFIMVVYTSIVFNRCSFNSIVKEKLILFTIFDILKTVTFMTTVLSFFFRILYIPYISLVVFVGINLIHLAMNKEEQEDIAVVVQTMYNNIVIQITTILPFAVFSYLFRGIGNDIVIYVFALLCTSVIFVLSFGLKKLSKDVYYSIQLNIELATRRMMLLAYSIASIVVMGVIITILVTSRISLTDIPSKYRFEVSDTLNAEVLTPQMAKKQEREYTFFNVSYEEEPYIFMSKTYDNGTSRYFNIKPIYEKNMQNLVIRASIISFIVLFLPLGTDCELYLRIENMLSRKGN